MATGGFRTAAGMAQAIRCGAVDMVSLARARAKEPDLPNRLLSGKDSVYQVKPITNGIKAIDKMGILKINCFTGQPKRVGNGQPPKPRESGLANRAMRALPRRCRG